MRFSQNFTFEPLTLFNGTKMNQRTLTELVLTAATNGAGKACGQPQDLLSPAAAYRRYGRSQVERWQREGLIAPESSAPKKMFDRLKLEAVAANSNRRSYLPVTGRSTNVV